MNLTLDLKDEAATRRLGRCLSGIIQKGDVILLAGDLGAGKTTLVRAVSKALGIDERMVTSPTFSIVHEYTTGRIPIVHIDLYRLGRNGDFLEAGVFDYIERDDHCVFLEWGEFLKKEHLGEKDPLFVKIIFSNTQNPNERRVEIMGRSKTWGSRLLSLKHCMEVEEP